MKTPLTPEEAARVFDLVAEAGALAPARQEEFLARACVGADRVRAEVASLLGFARRAPGFLARPALDRGLELLGLDGGSGLQPGDTLDGYRVVSLLGIGGMGEVYLAEDTVHGRQVALKLIGPSRAEEVRSRHFRHERRVLAALNHPNIARLYGSGVTPRGQAFLVMEYVQGERLDEFCNGRGLGVTERLALFRKVCAAVAYAHQNLVVHRDLKPANVRVTAEGEPKLLDFGIAKLLDPEDDRARPDPTVTLAGAMTPEYASPEQIKGETITTASDVYSLGIILYELLTGQRPFAHLKGRRPDEIARAICEEEPPRPSTVVKRQRAEGSRQRAERARTEQQATTGNLPLNTGLPSAFGLPPAAFALGDLDNIVGKALHKEVARRYPSVLALREDLRRYCEGWPVTARKDTLGYRAGKFVRRNQVGVLVAALGLLALVGGLVATAWQARVARQERDRARAALANAEVARRQTQGINDFLQHLLGSASSFKMGKDVKVIQVLDAASADVDQTLANEPEVLAEIHRTLGNTYHALGMVAAAERHGRTALTLFRRLYGAEDARTVDAEHSLITEEIHRGRYDECLQPLRHVIGWLRQHPKGNGTVLAEALSDLGFCYGQTHQFPEAEGALREAVALYASSDGENSRNYATALGQLGGLKREEGDLKGDIDLLERERDILSRVAPDGAQLVISELNQCLTLVEAGRFAEAEALLEPTRRDCRRIAGETENMYYTNVLFVAELLDFQREEFAKVAAGGQEVLGRFAAYLPPDDMDVVTTNYLLGVSLTRVGRAAEGEPYLRAALTHFNPVKRAFFLLYGNGETALGDCLLAQRRYGEAEKLLLTGYEDLRERLGVQHRFTIQAAGRLHDLYAAWDKPGEAARYVGGAR